MSAIDLAGSSSSSATPSPGICSSFLFVIFCFFCCLECRSSHWHRPVRVLHTPPCLPLLHWVSNHYRFLAESQLVRGLQQSHLYWIRTNSIRKYSLTGVLYNNLERVFMYVTSVMYGIHVMHEAFVTRVMYGMHAAYVMHAMCVMHVLHACVQTWMQWIWIHKKTIRPLS